MTRTAELMVGDRVRLTNFGKTDLTYRLRLLSMGVNIGTEVSVVRFAPLGCPIQIEVRSTSLTLRKDEAMWLEWERV